MGCITATYALGSSSVMKTALPRAMISRKVPSTASAHPTAMRTNHGLPSTSDAISSERYLIVKFGFGSQLFARFRIPSSSKPFLPLRSLLEFFWQSLCLFPRENSTENPACTSASRGASMIDLRNISHKLRSRYPYFAELYGASVNYLVKKNPHGFRTLALQEGLSISRAGR